MIVEWPHPDIAPKVINLRPVNQTRSAGESLTGFEQVADGINQRWGCSLEFNNLKRHTVPAYRAMLAKLRGRANVLRVPLFDSHYWPSDVAIGSARVPHSDGAPFSDGSLYAQGDIDGVTASGLKGANQITANWGQFAGLLDGGLYLGLEDQTYIATGVTWAGTVSTISFEPSLRKDYSVARVRLRPCMLMRLTEDTIGSHALEWGLATSPSLDMVEVLPDELSAMEAA